MEKNPRKRGKNANNKSPPKKAKMDSPVRASANPVPRAITNGNQVLNWDKFDIEMLINNIDHHLPKSDHLKFTTGVDKFNWDTVAFKGFTGQECREKWLEIQARLRRFRTLTGE